MYKEIEAIGTEVSEEDKVNREDLRDLLTITIDGEDFNNIDQGTLLDILEKHFNKNED